MFWPYHHDTPLMLLVMIRNLRLDLILEEIVITRNYQITILLKLLTHLFQQVVYGAGSSFGVNLDKFSGS